MFINGYKQQLPLIIISPLFNAKCVLSNNRLLGLPFELIK